MVSIVLTLAWVTASSGFQEDFESGALLVADGGQWVVQYPLVAGCSMGITSAAAHRGDAGFRFTNNSTTAQGNVGAISHHSTSGNALYGRTWIRVAPSAQQYFILMQNLSQSSSTQSMLDAEMRFDAGFAAGGYISDGGWVKDNGTVSLITNTWQLFEWSIADAGTSQGSFHVWIDGAPAVGTNGNDYSTLTIQKVAIGEPWSDTSGFMGTIDFDDIRWDATPQASRLQVATTALASAPDCLVLAVNLIDSVSGATAAAPYPVDVALTARTNGVAASSFYADNQCSTPVSVLILPAGSTGATVGWRPGSSSGNAAVRASHIDFLPGDVSFSFSLGTVSDGGTSAVPDGGASTAPVNPRDIVLVGCDCSSAGGSGFGLIVAALLLRRRRGTEIHL